VTTCCMYGLPSPTAHPTLPSNWRTVTLEKKSITDTGTIQKQQFEYVEEISTGDLYLKGLDRHEETGATIAQKCALLFLGLPFYTAVAIGANFVKIVTGTVFIAKRLFEEMRTQPLPEALANIFFTLIYEIPAHIATCLRNIVKALIFAPPLAAACLYGTLNPFEGRKWISKIEGNWHDADYHLDVRDDCLVSSHPQGSFEKNWEECQSCFRQIYDGKIIFYALCMQKRGNVNDKIGSLDRFVRIAAQNAAPGTSVPNAQSSVG
jgi:hypothetical protein